MKEYKPEGIQSNITAIVSLFWKTNRAISGFWHTPAKFLMMKKYESDAKKKVSKTKILIFNCCPFCSTF